MANYLTMSHAKNNEDRTPGSPMLLSSLGLYFFFSHVKKNDDLFHPFVIQTNLYVENHLASANIKQSSRVYRKSLIGVFVLKGIVKSKTLFLMEHCSPHSNTTLPCSNGSRQVTSALGILAYE